jgi:hypothetical protein
VSLQLWRAFPWDPGAAPGQPFSPEYCPPQHGYNRFDLPRSERGVLYLAGSPAHAVGELVQSYRNQKLDEHDLFILGHRLALVEVTLDAAPGERIADLCDPAELVRIGTGPDQVAARERRTTQGIAEQLFGDGWVGLRWWSAFFGEWHGTVLFLDRMDADWFSYGLPEPLHLRDPVIEETAHLLGIEIAG